MDFLQAFGGWLPLFIVAVIWGTRIICLTVNEAFYQWTLRRDRAAWLRQNGYEDLIIEPEDRA